MEITLNNFNPDLPIQITYHTNSGIDLGYPFGYIQNGNILTWDTNTFYEGGIPTGFEMLIIVKQNEETIYSELHTIQ